MYIEDIFYSMIPVITDGINSVFTVIGMIYTAFQCMKWMKKMEG